MGCSSLLLFYRVILVNLSLNIFFRMAMFSRILALGEQVDLKAVTQNRSRVLASEWGRNFKNVIITHLLHERLSCLPCQKCGKFYSVQLSVKADKPALGDKQALPLPEQETSAAAERHSGQGTALDYSQRAVNRVVSILDCTGVILQGSDYWSGHHWAKYCTNRQQVGLVLALESCAGSCKAGSLQCFSLWGNRPSD